MNKNKLERIKILQSGGLVYTPFVLDDKQIESQKNTFEQKLDYRTPFLKEDARFPVEPVKIYKPSEKVDSSNKSQQIKEETIVDYSFPNPTSIDQKETEGKIYKPSEKEEFKSDLFNAYLSALIERGIKNAEAFAKRLVTQDALESRWGQSTLSKYFNFGGIKDFGGNGSQKDTTEYINGVKQTIKQSFRKFKDLNEYVNYKINLVDKKWNVFRYNPEQYYDVIISGKQKYATDPNYAAKLNRLFKQTWK